MEASVFTASAMVHPLHGSAPLHAARPPHWGPRLWVSDWSLSLKELSRSQGSNDDTLHPPLSHLV